ncbi:unnamed protein product, partial [Sphacelaria rigidula]
GACGGLSGEGSVNLSTVPRGTKPGHIPPAKVVEEAIEHEDTTEAVTAAVQACSIAGTPQEAATREECRSSGTGDDEEDAHGSGGHGRDGVVGGGDGAGAAREGSSRRRVHFAEGSKNSRNRGGGHSDGSREEQEGRDEDSDDMCEDDDDSDGSNDDDDGSDGDDVMEEGSEESSDDLDGRAWGRPGGREGVARILSERFLAGEEEGVDYREVDGDDRLDDLDQLERDEQDRWFRSEDYEDNH